MTSATSVTSATIKLADIQIKDDPPKRYPDIDLELLVGKKIKRIRGSISDPFDTVPIFHIRKIEFEDGTMLWVDSEHDIPYIATGEDEEFPVLSENNMINLWCKLNPDECEEDE